MTYRELMNEVEQLLGRSIPCKCGRTHHVQTQAAVVEPGAIEHIPRLIDEYFPSGCVLIVADENTYAAAGEAVEEVVGRGRQVEAFVLRPQSGQPVGDEGFVEQVRERLADGFAAAIAVGSGTVNDLAKLASTQAGVPYGVVGTAASMNGYTSAIAAIYSRGLKRTLPATPAVWVVGDLDVLAAAPVRLTRAGLADLMSKPSSTSDWRAASWLLDEYYCPFCAQVADRAESTCRAAAAEIGRCEPEAVGLLFAGLLLSGLSMAMAGSSSPASGGEHLISHVWDMKAYSEGGHHALHGEQVAIGTLVSASVWQLLRQTSPPDEGRIEEIISSRRSWEEEVARIRELLGPTLAPPAIEEYQAKRPDDDELRRRLHKLAEGWGDFWNAVGEILRPVEVLRRTLEVAGAPTRVSDIGFADQDLRQAFAAAKYIRRRYTVHDLATDLGLFDEIFEPALKLSGTLAAPER